MNFAYVYATCHKEGHAIAAKAGLWRAPLDKAGLPLTCDEGCAACEHSLPRAQPVDQD